MQADCERGSALDEVEWVESLAGHAPQISGIVAFAPMDAGPGTAAALEALRGRPLVARSKAFEVSGERLSGLGSSL